MKSRFCFTLLLLITSCTAGTGPADHGHAARNRQ